MLTQLAKGSGSGIAEWGILNWRAVLKGFWDPGMFRDSRNYFLSKLVPGAAGLLSVMVFIRLVGYAEYGRYAVLFAMAMAFAAGLSGWLSQGTLRFQSKYTAPDDYASFHRATRAGTGLSVACGSVALAIALWLTNGHSRTTIGVSLGFFAAVLIYTVVLAEFQASIRSRTVLIYECIRSVGGFLFPLLLVLASGRRDHRLLLLGVLLGYMLPSLLHGLARRREVAVARVPRRLPLPHRERELLSEVWRYGWPIGLWFLCQQGLAVSDRYFIQKYAGYAAAGIYASMYDVIVRSFSLIFMPIALAAQPLANKHWNAGARARSVQVIRSAVRLQFCLFFPVAGLLFLSSSILTRLVLGRPNAEASSIVLVLAAGGFLWQLALLTHKPLELLCQTKRMLAGIATALFVNICGNYFLIPRFGFRAPAYVMIASSLTYLLVVRIATPKSFRVQDAVVSENALAALSASPE